MKPAQMTSGATYPRLVEYFNVVPAPQRVAVTARGKDGVGVLVEVQGVGRGRHAEDGQVRRGEDHERRRSLRWGRRHVRGRAGG